MVKEADQRPDASGRSGHPAGDRTPGQGTRETMAETAMAAAESARSAATEKVEQQKRAASRSLDAFARAVHRASDELSKEDQTAAAQLIQQAAGGLESLSRSLSNQSLGDMVASVREFGRRNPAALAGGAALIGLALGRVARTAADGSNSSGEASSPSQSRAAGAQAANARTGPARGASGAADDFPASRASVPSPSQSDAGGKRSGGSND
jgi:hypothetical protein